MIISGGRAPRASNYAATSDGKKFVECALDPLAAMAMKSNGVPDRSSGKVIVVHHKTDITVTPNAQGQISVCMLPTLPAGLGVYCDGTTTPANVSGKFISVDGNPKQILASGSGAAAGYSMIPYQEYIASPPIAGGTGGALPNLNPYSAAKARVIAMALEIVDKATSLTSQGDITVVQVPFRCSETSLVGLAAPVGQTCSGKYWQRTVDKPIFTDQQATNVQGYKCFKPKEGAYAVATRADPDWNMRDWAPSNYTTSAPPSNAWTAQEFLPVMDQFAALSGGTSQMPFYGQTDGSSDWVGFTFVDTGTTAIFATCSGLNTTTPQPLRFIATTCVEYQPEPTSTVAKFTSPSPAHDPLALETVSRAQTVMPMAVTRSEKQSFFGTLLSLVGQGVRGLAKSGIPIVSEVAAGANSIVGAFVPEFRSRG